MSLLECEDRSDGYRWECRKQAGGRRHKQTLSIGKGSVCWSWSWVVGRGFQVVGRGSQVVGRGFEVVGRGLLIGRDLH